MANALYDHARESFLSQNPALDWDTNTIKVMLVKTAQTFTASHQYVAALTGANIVARSSALTTKTVTSGVADADDVTFTAPTTGQTCNLIVYKDNASDDATSPLIAFIDTGTGLPVTTTGGDVVVTWDSGANKIFKL